MDYTRPGDVAARRPANRNLPRRTQYRRRNRESIGLRRAFGDVPDERIETTALEADDSAYVERIRSGLEWIRRWRPWMIAFHATMLVAWIAILSQWLGIVQWLGRMQGVGAAVMPGFTTGAMFGFVMATHLSASIHHLANSCFASMRESQLLVRCHDALQALAPDAARTTDAVEAIRNRRRRL